MLKALALLRTLLLAALIVYTVWAMPYSFGLLPDPGKACETCQASLPLLTRAVWAAIAWIAFDTAVGWILAGRKPKAAKAEAKEPKKTELPPGEPPFAPPPR